MIFLLLRFLLMNYSLSIQVPQAPQTPPTSPRTKEAQRLRAKAEGSLYAPVASTSAFFEKRERLVNSHVDKGLLQYDLNESTQALKRSRI